MSCLEIRRPVAHGLGDGILERAAAGIHADHFCAQQAHAEDVQRLPTHVLRAHVDHAIQAEQGAHRGRGNAVLAGAGLGDDAALAHAPSQQRLPEAVVDLVRARVQQVLALEVDLGAAEVGAEPPGMKQRRGAAGVVEVQVGQLGDEPLVVPDFEISAFQAVERRD